MIGIDFNFSNIQPVPAFVDTKSEEFLRHDLPIMQHLRALHLFDHAFINGKMFRLWASVWQQPRSLLDLNILKAQPRACNVRDWGIKVVMLREIIGSEGRSQDFDLGFHPMQTRMRERWASVAAARLYPSDLPPVELIQVGDAYFVRDGHHRISVAASLGQEFIDAHVLHWSCRWVTSLETVHRLLNYRLYGI